MTKPTNLEQRVVELELIYTHLQHTVQELDKVVFEQSKRIDLLQRELKLLVNEFRQMRDASRDIRRPEDEIPPHY